jgi:hypothetical protein
LDAAGHFRANVPPLLLATLFALLNFLVASKGKYLSIRVQVCGVEVCRNDFLDLTQLDRIFGAPTHSYYLLCDSVLGAEVRQSIICTAREAGGTSREATNL